MIMTMPAVLISSDKFEAKIITHTACVSLCHEGSLTYELIRAFLAEIMMNHPPNAKVVGTSVYEIAEHRELAGVSTPVDDRPTSEGCVLYELPH